MSLSTFARSSLAQFVVVYKELSADGIHIPPSELETRMWANICAREHNVEKMPFKIPYELVKKSKVHLPYMPEDIKYTGCSAIKKNGGLYTPCCGKIKEGDLCQTCNKSEEAGELSLGMLSERDESIKNGLFKPITFGEWMRDHKMSLDDVYSALAEVGASIKIPSEELVTGPRMAKAVRRRGRPAKSDESESDAEEKKLPKLKAKKSKVESDSEEESLTKQFKEVALDSDSEDEHKAKPHKASAVGSLPSITPRSEEKSSLLNAPKAKESKEDEPKEVKKPKAKKTEESKEDEPKEVKKPKAKKTKEESEESKEDEPKEVKKPKAKKAKESKDESKEDEPKEVKKPKAKKAKEEPKNEETEPVEPPELIAEPVEPEDEGQECEIDGTDYMLRNRYIFNKDDGSMMGKIGDDGDVEWM